MGILSGNGILSGTGILDGRGMLFQSGIIVPPSTDPDAAAYMALVEAAGGTVTTARRNFINDFYVAAKEESYYTSLKRLYLPIWGVAAANAIDLITGDSGTFSGSVAHNSGHVILTGGTGYFNAGNFGSDGLSKNNYSLAIHIYQIADNDGVRYCGLGNARFTAIGRIDATNTRRHYCDFASTADFSVPSTSLITQTVNGSRILTSRQLTSGYTQLESAAVPSGTFPTGQITYGGYNLSGDEGTGINHISAGSQGIGLFGYGLALSDAQNESYSLHLKNLWEGCTGLTLP